MQAQSAQRLGIRKISDLAAHADLRLGFSNEFMSRGDGWPGLRQNYGLSQFQVHGLDHDLAYRALADGAIVANPFVASADVVALLRLRARQLRRQAGRRGRRLTMVPWRALRHSDL